MHLFLVAFLFLIAMPGASSSVLVPTRSLKVCALPMVLDLVVLPFLDFLHLVPVMTKELRQVVFLFPRCFGASNTF